jgi:hypothetical protein
MWCSDRATPSDAAAGNLVTRALARPWLLTPSEPVRDDLPLNAKLARDPHPATVLLVAPSRQSGSRETNEGGFSRPRPHPTNNRGRGDAEG